MAIERQAQYLGGADVERKGRDNHLLRYYDVFLGHAQSLDGASAGSNGSLLIHRSRVEVVDVAGAFAEGIQQGLAASP
jgi:hypothetical protein